MRSFFIAILLGVFSLSHAAAANEWRWLPYKDAVAMDASSYAPKLKKGKVPKLVVSCNNLIRLAYLEWPSDIGIKLKDLPNNARVTVNLSSEEETKELWFVSRPEKKITTVISHDRAFPKLLTEHKSVALRAVDKEGLFDLSASFPLSGLANIMEAHNLPCR